MITYNNKDILKSFIGNNRVIKKYLNNEVVYGTPDFAQYYNIQGYDNYEVVGNLTIKNGIVSGFSSYPTQPYTGYYIRIVDSMDFGGNFKIATRFKLDTNPTGNTTVIGRRGSGFSFFINGNNRIYYTLRNSSNTSFYAAYSNITGTFKVDKWYAYLATKENNSLHTVITEEESGTIVFDGTIILTDTIKSGGMAFGVDYADVAYLQFLGSIDLNETYIKVNGKYWFNGNSNYKELLDCNPNVYLQSTGTQYIDTEILPNSNLEFDVKFLTRNTIGASGYGCIFGGRYNSGNNDLQVTTFRNNQANTSGAFRFGLNTTDASQSAGITINVATEAHFHNLTYSTNTTNYTVSTYNFTNPRKIFLFGLNGNGTMMQSGKGCKIYYAKFNKSTQRSYFVPVPEGLQIGSYKVPSNGMFDIVTQTFFENKGSGEFIWGVDL